MSSADAGFDARSAPWQPAGPEDAPAVRRLVDRAAAVDGVAAVSGHVLDAVDAGTAELLLARLCDGGDQSRGVNGADGGVGADDVIHAGGVVGAAVAVGGDPAEVLVDPGHRGRGMGTSLVRDAVEHQGAVWAYGDLPPARAVAQSLGLVQDRVLLQLRRALPVQPTPMPVTQLPARGSGIRIRTFVPGQDEGAFLQVNARAFAWHPEQGRLDAHGLRAQMDQDWFDPQGFFLAVADVRPDAADTASDDTDAVVTTAGGARERLLGFHWTKVHDHDSPPGLGGVAGQIGEIYVLGVDPTAGVRGLGAPLTAAGLDHLSRLGLRTAMLYVEADNRSAIRLYERFGFSTFLTNVVYRRPASPP